MKTLALLVVAAAAAALALSTPASAQTQFFATINAAQAMTNSPGFGTGTFTLSADATSLAYSVTLQNLYDPGTTNVDTVTMMHFHDEVLPDGVVVPDGPVAHGVYDASVSPEPGMPFSPLAGATVTTPGAAPAPDFSGNAGTPVTFNGVWSTSDKIEPLTPGIVKDLEAGYLYYNVHTMGYPDGAIRGQILLPGQANPTPKVTPVVPETSSFGLAAAGLLPLAGVALRRRRRA